MKKFIILVMMLTLLAFAACSDDTHPAVTPGDESGVSPSTVIDNESELEDQSVIVEPIYGETRQKAYYLAMSRLVTNHIFPNGSEAKGLEDGAFGKIAENKFAVCDVDCDGRDELIIIFTTTDTAGMHAQIYDYNEENGSLYKEWGAGPVITFYDNGYAAVDNVHNQTHGDLWPYYLHRYLPDSDSYEVIAWVHSRNRELSEELDFDYPYDIDTSNHGEVYYIDEDLSDSSGYEEELPVDITKYEAWLNRHIGKAKEIEVNYLPITSENISSLLG